MRQLSIQLPVGHENRIRAITHKNNAVNLIHFQAQSANKEALDVWIFSVSNNAVEQVLEELEKIPETSVSFLPAGVFALHQPTGKTPEQVVNVKPRSPIEIYMSGLQSIGSWRAFLGYAFVSSVVVWIGLATNSVFLLIAAMLLAPFASPAMNTALATARGDTKLLRRNLLRYFVALAATALTTALLTWLLGPQTPTSLMVEFSQISSTAVMLPLVVGAAGALNLSEAEQNSLVAGAATGFLVAAALAPPTAIIGMAMMMGRLELVISGVFLVILQLSAINITGALVLRWYGLSTRSSRYQRGTKTVFPVGIAVSALIVGILLAIQFWNMPDFQRSSLEGRMASQVRELLEDNPAVTPVEVQIRFPRSGVGEENFLLGIIYIVPEQNNQQSNETLQAEIHKEVKDYVQRETGNTTPVIQVNVLTYP